jgi:hypothetical protein
MTLADEVTAPASAPISTPAAAPVAAPAPAPAAAPAAPDPAVASAGSAPPSTPDVAAPAATPAATDPAANPVAAAVANKTTVAAPAPQTPHDPGSSLLTGDAPKEEPKAAEPPKTEAQAQEAPLPTYQPLKLPENYTADEKIVGTLDQILGKFQNGTKAEQAAVESMRQELADMYIEHQKAQAAAAIEQQTKNWNAVRENWRDAFRKDPEIGGNRQETTLKQAGAVLTKYGSVMGEQALSNLKLSMRVTGMGDNPEFIRFVNWASNFVVEKAKPVAATVPKPPVVQSRSARRYGQTT